MLAMAMHGEGDEASRIIYDTVCKLHAPRTLSLPDLFLSTRSFRELASAARAYSGNTRWVLWRGSRLARGDPTIRSFCTVTFIKASSLDFERHCWLAVDPKELYDERGFDYANAFASRGPFPYDRPRRLQAAVADQCLGTSASSQGACCGGSLPITACRRPGFLDDRSLQAAEKSALPSRPSRSPNSSSG